MEKVRCILIVDGKSSEKRTGVWYNNQVLKVGWGAGLGGVREPLNFCRGARSPVVLLLGVLILFYCGAWYPLNS